MRDWTPDELRSIADRLRRARIDAGYDKASDAVRKFGWGYSRYMNYENGERAVPPKQAILFAAAFGVTVDYIYFGKGYSLNKIEGVEPLSSPKTRHIPLLALDNMDELKRIAEGSEPTSSTAMPVFGEEALPGRCVFIDIRDKSMTHPHEPVSFEPGDKALIDLDAVPSPSDFVLALVPEEQTALFRLYREVGRAEDGSIIVDLVPLNPNFRTIRISSISPGQVIGVCRSIHRVFDLTMPLQRPRLG
ncbi:LexA family transcriptional regulator [Rhodomicrobium lacus]|uniref:LexA family transcriptional regulator n=1 Tax=Rhodomicrobium lacus TaxID=2498452 RepID=UPI0026E18558|nr:helix-turn-helix domain-containing protein [Rhodomicrobium lacus]WKW50846.1 helix-turn-helix domain-containing protein [Rhodomicrobium lacus]